MPEPDKSLDATQLATELGATRVRASLGATRGRVERSSVELGEELGGHRLERRIGAGGMGEVFAATRLRDDASVALKILGRASPTNLYRFKREFRALADVEHENLVRLHELVVPASGLAFFTMELIDGQGLTSYVRGRTPSAQLPSLERLQRVMQQLVEGILELHARGCIHRDLKPSNVLVDRSGRVVILDFGLVSEGEGEGEGVTHDGQLLGTPAYMAPEQAMAGRTGAAADYYALGVMLYECLCGERPFTGTAMQVMLAKQSGELPDPGARVAGIPPELRELCLRLLQPEPELRPTSRELLAALGDRRGSATGPSSVGSRSTGAFIGRAAELARLRAALRDVRETRAAVTVLVHGPGGAGKTALLRQFQAKLREREPALILTGRCLERESVPYKGFDAVVDALSVHLRRLSPVEAASLQPRHAGATIKLFPVLADVWERVSAPQASLTATQRRRLGLAGLRELVVRLCDRQPLIICIDDFQWADIDSVRLLASLLRPPEAPALLLVLAFRNELELRPALRELYDPATFAGRELRELELGPLAHAESMALALALLGEPPDPARAEVLARRAQGSPFWLIQLVLGAELGAELELDELLAGRLAAVEPPGRELLQLLALAGAPLSLAALEQLLGAAVESREASEALAEGLVVRGLLVRSQLGAVSLGLGLSTQTGAGVAFELAHPRMREPALEGLEPGERARLALGLATVLAELGADAKTLARYFAEAGDRVQAADYAERSAREAAEALAFALAVEAYRETLELLGPDADPARRQELRLALAEQLIYLGHASEAADLLLSLADEMDALEGAEQRRRAVTQLARCGRIDEAIELMRSLLAALGEPMPRGHWGAVFMFVSERLRLLVRGEHFEPRPLAEVDPTLLARVDTLMGASIGLAIHEVSLTQALGGRGLRLAFDAGDPRRLGMGLAYRYLAFAGLGRFELANDLAVQSREIAALADDFELDRCNDMADAMVEWFRRDSAKSLELFTRLLTRGDQHPLPDWLRSFATIRYADLCRLTGDFAEFRRNYPRWIAIARERGNLHEYATLEALAASVAMHYAELDVARVHLDTARAGWQASRYTFTDATIDIIACDLVASEGRVEAAAEALAQLMARMKDSGLGHMRTLHELAQSLRMRVIIAQLLAAPAKGALYRQAKRCIRAHRRGKQPRRKVEALLSQAALDSLAGDDAAARSGWRRALQHCARYDMAAQLAALRLRLAAHTGGRESQELESQGLAYLERQGLEDSEHFVQLLVPARARVNRR